MEKVKQITPMSIYKELKILEEALKRKGIVEESDLESNNLSSEFILSEKSFAKEWLDPKEDEAWKDL